MAMKMVEGPRQRQEFQNFSEAVATAEREGGYPAALRAFEARVDSLSSSVVWRAHLELAECAKRSANVLQVKHHLAQALQAHSGPVQVWLEACRTLDELGELEECRTLLEQGLEHHSVSNEQLCLKLVRVYERLGDHGALRSLVSSLRTEPPEKTCKVLLEAVHSEVRAGNGEAVRPLLRCLMLRLPHQGPIYCEASRVDAILGHWKSALSIAEQGVKTCLKYGPLWFLLLRLVEKAYGARAVKEYAGFALKNICHELHWKVHFEVAAAFGRAGNLPESHESIGNAALSCPKHLRWKVWLLAARSELWDGSVETCRKLLAQAQFDAPSRVQVAVCIERARAEEFLDDLDEAREALRKAYACEGHDWKVYLEHIFMEARQGCLKAAKEITHTALELHPATGRLWSALVALEHSGEDSTGDAAMVAFRRAVREVPKSGEVWCEGARINMNPMVPHFNLGRAYKCLEFAVHLTPQYGDSFLELFRLRILLEMRIRMRKHPLAVGLLGVPPELHAQPQQETSALSAVDQGKLLPVAALVAQQVSDAMAAELKSADFAFTVGAEVGVAPGADGDCVGTGLPPFQLSQLEVLCAYADPNYGFLWLWCRQSALSTPKEVLARMTKEVTEDLLVGATRWAYAWAVACSLFGLGYNFRFSSGTTSGGLSPPDGQTVEQVQTAQECQSDPVARDYALGSMRLARCVAHCNIPLDRAERRRLIFGSDILCI
mmetsp:Transcript_26031/g.49856  ORF Transcript_26031/g.49856 Transcript_26031/m.49856 type:complete len:720 (-) Transcript_26031:47-2206(-)